MPKIDWGQVVTEKDRKAEAARQEAQQFLKETDWMVIRAAEGGKPMPDDVTEKRKAARARLT